MDGIPVLVNAITHSQYLPLAVHYIPARTSIFADAVASVAQSGAPLCAPIGPLDWIPGEVFCALSPFLLFCPLGPTVP